MANGRMNLAALHRNLTEFADELRHYGPDIPTPMLSSLFLNFIEEQCRIADTDLMRVARQVVSECYVVGQDFSHFRFTAVKELRVRAGASLKDAVAAIDRAKAEMDSVAQDS